MNFLMHSLTALCFIVCGWCAGDSMNVRAQMHLDALRKTIALLEQLHREINFRRSDLNVLLQKMILEGQISPETQSFQTLQPFPQLTSEEKLCFSECFSGIGHREAKQECLRLELYLEMFQQTLQESQTKARKQAELSHKLGLAAGLAMAILLG